MIEPSAEELQKWKQPFRESTVQPEPVEEAEEPGEIPWQELAAEALHGLAGEFVNGIEPHTEADPVALLVQFLTMFGSVIGRNAHFQVEADRHYLNLFALLVGETAKGRKGTSFGYAKAIFQTVEEGWAKENIVHGLSSGEGLIWHVRDPIEETKPVKERGRFTGEYDTAVIDQGVSDKRLLVVESEFARTLKVMARDTNTLSAIIRQAWDSGDLRTMTKNSPARATGAHVSVIGHITRGELVRYLDSTEAGNGFANRFLFVCVRRSKCLPEGGNLNRENLGPLVRRLTEAVQFAQNTGELKKDERARTAWGAVYPSLSEGKPGLLGSVTARAEAQVMRIACTYAALDLSNVIRVEHIRAALALWEYCERSARCIFGDALGDPLADELLKLIRNAPGGVTRTQIRDFFGRHKSSHHIDRALTNLLEQKLIGGCKEETGGKPKSVFSAIESAT